MFNDDPFALLISWTCFGNWLPGDERGYVSNTRLLGGVWLPRENVPGTPYARDDPLTRHQARVRMNQPVTRLTSAQAIVVAESIVKAAQKRDWRIPRAAIMANHVHVVISNCPDDGPAVRRILKGVSQSALSDAVGRNQRWWTRGGSDRYLHTEDTILAAIRYVAEQQYKLAEVIDMKIFPVA